MPPPRTRPPRDLVGFAHRAEGIEKVVALALEQEKGRMEAGARLEPIADDEAFIAGISPHDDYRYASRVYVHLYPHVRAKHVIAIGVAHKAAMFRGVEGRLVFDGFPAWQGPYGEVPISPLRKKLLAGLAEEDAFVQNELHLIEHSLEAMIPFLQHFNRKVSFCPVLVPFMSCDRAFELARRTAKVLHEVMQSEGLVLGEDVALVLSSDAVHYGNDGWGGKGFADFGVDRTGYDRAVSRDLGFVDDYLAGPTSLDKIAGLYRELVHEDFHQYKVTWCGRFSVTFGLALLHFLEELAGHAPPHGMLLRYGTTLDPGENDPDVEGLGFTAPASLRHWVGFASVGYRRGDAER